MPHWKPFILQLSVVLSVFVFSFSAGAVDHCLEVNEAERTCVVTSERGDLTEGGLIQCLTDPRCDRVTFGVSEVEPLRSLVEVRDGVTLDGTRPGGGRIELRYDEDYSWSNPIYQSCLLRILSLPPTNGTRGATVSNLILRNPFGQGLCLLRREGRITQENQISNITIHSGAGRGIDLGTSPNNELTNITVIGEGTETTEGIYIGGINNTIEGGRIEGYSKGVSILPANGGNLIHGVSFYSIRNLPIDHAGAAGATNRPQSLRGAFVGSNVWTLTGRVPEDAAYLQLYKYEYVSSSNKNYIYKLPIPDAEIRDAEDSRSVLTAGWDRFVYQITTAQTGLRTTDSVILTVDFPGTGTTGTGTAGTTEFSPVYNGGTPSPAPVQGDPNCNASDWFWKSYDYPKMDGGTENGWHVDYDRDGLANGPCSTCGHPLDQSEDTDRDCRWPDLGESNPDDWRSHYDFDCDGRADHRYSGLRALDNCVKVTRGDGTEYSRDSFFDRVEASGACNRDRTSDPIHAHSFESWNPDQRDSDNDGLGDLCEDDPDNDGVPSGMDNCPTVFNPDQRNSDMRENRAVMPPLLDETGGDACVRIREQGFLNVTDRDTDSVPDAEDNCPDDRNWQQRDRDGDGIGDQCDFDQRADADGDGHPNLADLCPYDFDPAQTDSDDDKVGNACDLDDDNDGLADYEEDFNRDGVIDRGETNPLNPDSDLDGLCDGPGWGSQRISCIRPLDNCPLVVNRDQLDEDEDSIGDVCDANPDQWLGLVDSDGDGELDSDDNCPHIANNTEVFLDYNGIAFAQNDTDRDGNGDPCDSDDDNDGLDDATENGMFDARRWDRVTAKGLPSRDNDLENDGFIDGVDVCPHLPFRCENGEYPETDEECFGVISNPSGNPSLLPESRCGNYPVDDIDGDGIRNNADNCVFIANRRQMNLDGDDKGDACDLDEDNDDNTNELTDECWDYLRSEDNRLEGDFGPIQIIAARNSRHCDFDESANYRLHAWDPNSDHERGIISAHADLRCDGGGIGFGLPRSLTRCEASDPCPEFFNPIGAEGSCGSGLSPSVSFLDADFDLVPDERDNCQLAADTTQADLDRDGTGDVCDPDNDGDGIPNLSDNCPAIANADQTNTDGFEDGGDACDPNPFSRNVPQVQGGGAPGGCGSLASRSLHPSLVWPWLALITLILFLRRRKLFS